MHGMYSLTGSLVVNQWTHCTLSGFSLANHMSRIQYAPITVDPFCSAFNAFVLHFKNACAFTELFRFESKEQKLQVEFVAIFFVRYRLPGQTIEDLPRYRLDGYKNWRTFYKTYFKVYLINSPSNVSTFKWQVLLF